MNATRFTRSASCLTAGLILALSGAAFGQSAPAAPAPPAPPVIDTPLHSVTSLTSSWSMTQSNDGRSVTVSSKDGKIAAEIDGKAVAEDRITQKGNTVTVKDDAGNVVFDSPVPGFESFSRPLASSPYGTARAWARSGSRGGLSFADPQSNTIHITTDAPKVMVGVQLLEPDSSLRGHLGLKENESTLISAVYDGLPASQAGLEPYDIVVAINGKSPAAPEAVRKALRETESGKSISLDILHRGQKKTVSITPEKFDGDKLDKAKVNSIAAVAGAPSAVAGADPFAGGGFASAGNPFVATIPGQGGQPGRAITLFGTANQEEMAKRLQAQADRLHEQLGGLNALNGQNFIDLNKVMEERMRKMEEMMQKMMDRQNAAPASTIKKDENKS